MKKVLLNDVILGLRKEVLVAETGKYISDERGMQVAETLPVKFGKLAIDVIYNSPTETYDESMLLFDLLEKLQSNLDVVAPTELELSDTEFDYVERAIAGQAVIVKARFRQMVQRLNAKA